MKKMYYAINSYGNTDKYFVEISKTNKIIFTDKMCEATKVNYEDGMDLIPLIEQSEKESFELIDVDIY